MSLFAFQVPQEYGYVILSATGSLFVSVWLGIRVGSYRKAAGVPYPHQYATVAEIEAAGASGDAKKQQALYLYNCAQRGHYNFLENHTSFLFSLLVAGVRRPVATAVMGAAWSIGRIMYAVGYTNPDKKNGKGRLIGSWSNLIQLALYFMAGWDGYKMVTA